MWRISASLFALPYSRAALSATCHRGRRTLTRPPRQPERPGEVGHESPSATLQRRGDLGEGDHTLEQRRSPVMGACARLADDAGRAHHRDLTRVGVSRSDVEYVAALRVTLVIRFCPMNDAVHSMSSSTRDR